MPSTFAFLLATTMVVSHAPTQDDARELTMKEMALLQQIEGKWRCKSMVTKGRLSVPPKDTLVGVEFDHIGMTYFGDVVPKPQPKWRFERFHPEDSRIDLVCEVDDKVYRRSIKLLDGNVVICSIHPSGKELPKVIEPRDDNHLATFERIVN